MLPDQRKDDPAFLYFPENYRWSMGLLICLGGAPWTGVDIDEVNRVGRALLDKVGDDTAWFEEWTRMGDKVEARGREALRAGHKLTAASCFMRASRYYQTGERFIHPRSSAAWMFMPSRSRCLRKPPRSCAGRASSRWKSPTRIRACRGCWCIPIPKPRTGALPPPWCSSTASTSPRSCNTATASPTSPRAASAV